MSFQDVSGPAVLASAVIAAGAKLFCRARGAGVLRALGGLNRSPLLAVAGRLVLSPQHTVHLIRAADRAYLVGAHGSGFTVLASGAWSEWQRGIPESEAGAERHES